jgi:hypothetical protein
MVPLEEEEVPTPLITVLPQVPIIVVPPEEEVPQGPPVTVSPEEEEVPATLSWSRRKEGDALSWSMTMAPIVMMKALYRPW